MTGPGDPDDRRAAPAPAGSPDGENRPARAPDATRADAAAADAPTRAAPGQAGLFDERCYIATFADVAVAVAEERCASGRAHFDGFGAAEDRLREDRYQAALACAQSTMFPAHSIDRVLATATGEALIEGWVDDEIAPLSCLRVLQQGRLLAHATESFRYRRADVEAQEGIDDGRLVGFSAVVRLGPDPDPQAPLSIGLELGGFRRLVEMPASPVSIEALRRRALGRIRDGRRHGLSAPAIAAGLGTQPRDLLGRLGAALFARNAGGACRSRYDPPRRSAAAPPRPPAVSVVVRLREAEAVFLQTALFARAGVRADDLEMVFVSDDPAIQEQALREASASAMLYGVPVSVVSLPGRVGYAAAINAGARHASGGRLLVVEPGVVPLSPDWLDGLCALWRDQPASRSALFGGFLRDAGGRAERRVLEIGFEDGTAGAGSGARREVRLARLALRDTHGAGGPEGAREPPSSLRAIATAGSLLAIDPELFRRLGGLDARYNGCRIAHADLGLRAAREGIATWMHEVPLAHLPAARAAAPVDGDDEALDLLDRALFTADWQAEPGLADDRDRDRTFDAVPAFRAERERDRIPGEERGAAPAAVDFAIARDPRMQHGAAPVPVGP